MKEKRHSLPLFSLCMIGLFFLFSCSDKGTETEDNQYFQVVRTDTDIDYTGGECCDTDQCGWSGGTFQRYLADV